MKWKLVLGAAFDPDRAGGIHIPLHGAWAVSLLRLLSTSSTEQRSGQCGLGWWTRWRFILLLRRRYGEGRQSVHGLERRDWLGDCQWRFLDQWAGPSGHGRRTQVWLVRRLRHRIANRHA